MVATDSYLFARKHITTRLAEGDLFASEDGAWITVNGTHIFIKEGETPGDAFKRVTGKTLEVPTKGRVSNLTGKVITSVGKVGDTDVWVSDNSSERTTSMVMKSLEKLPEDHMRLVKNVEIMTGDGRELSAGGEQFKEGAHYAATDKTVRVFAQSLSQTFFDDLVSHEVGHAVWRSIKISDVGLKNGFRLATEKDGGITNYSRAWLRDDRGFDAGVSENFAEVYASNIMGRRTVMGKKYPETYKAFDKIYSKVGK